MALGADELLRSLAGALRERIGPAVGDPFARTQAFMAAVILEKLAGELANAPADAAAAASERAALAVDVLASAPADSPVATAANALAGDGSDATWNALVGALYTERGRLGADAADAMLARVRVALRARLDRALAYAS